MIQIYKQIGHPVKYIKTGEIYSSITVACRELDLKLNTQINRMNRLSKLSLFERIINYAYI
jgi:hypothetical protein